MTSHQTNLQTGIEVFELAGRKHPEDPKHLSFAWLEDYHLPLLQAKYTPLTLGRRFPHAGNLIATFRYIGLVDTDGINPVFLSFCFREEALYSCGKIDGN